MKARDGGERGRWMTNNTGGKYPSNIVRDVFPTNSAPLETMVMLKVTVNDRVADFWLP